MDIFGPSYPAEAVSINSTLCIRTDKILSKMALKDLIELYSRIYGGTPLAVWKQALDIHHEDWRNGYPECEVCDIFVKKDFPLIFVC
jgi:hypothetical protein